MRSCWAIGVVKRVMIRINITESRDQDLDIFLRSGSGTNIEVSTDNGGTNANYTDTRFRTLASGGTAITAGSAPFNGEFKPEGSFNGFNGAAATGFWRLSVTDDSSSGGNGTLNSFELAICAQ